MSAKNLAHSIGGSAGRVLSSVVKLENKAWSVIAGSSRNSQFIQALKWVLRISIVTVLALVSLYIALPVILLVIGVGALRAALEAEPTTVESYPVFQNISGFRNGKDGYGFYDNFDVRHFTEERDQ